MRPVDKGKCPYGGITKYQEARGPLIERLGEYCSYCEMHLDAGLAVEHVQPKSRQADKEFEWDNLLLGCPNCNSTKGNTDINDNNVDDYLWPDIHNTLLALEYSEGGIIRAKSALPLEIQAKAQKLISLVGLDKTPDISFEVSDRRWQNRKEAWDMAQRAKSRIHKQASDDMREQVAETAKANGYFSIWMTVFSDDSDMKKRIIRQYQGTAVNAFDTQGNPIPRTSQGI